MAKWKPRSSQIGAYLSCMYRAAFDRALAEGLMTLEAHDDEAVKEARKSSPYAAFGTWCHFYLQDALRCEFEGGREDHIPDAETKGAAANLFAGDSEAAEAAVRTAVTVAAKNMPIPKDGKPWLAEASCKSKNLNGHLDFLSRDLEDIVDLKMTSKKPIHGVCKPEHFAQVAGAYPLLVRERFGVLPKRATILYVDMHATWACPVIIDLTTPERIDYIDQINDYAGFLRSKGLFKAAAPCIGPHCSDGWCPYTSLCKHRIMPPPGNFTDHGLPPVPNMKITGL